MPWLSRFSTSSISTDSQPSTTLFTPSTLPSQDLKTSSSLSCLRHLADYRSQAVFSLPSSKRRLSFSRSSSWILVLSKLMLWQLRSELYFAASSCSSSTCTVARWSSIIRQNLRFSSSRCITIASLLFSASLVSDSSSAMSSRSPRSISISLSRFESSFWNSLRRASSRFSLALISAESSSFRSITQARFFCSRLMSSMALSSAISSPWILSTEDSTRAFSLQSSQNLELQSCIVKLELQAYTSGLNHCYFFWAGLFANYSLNTQLIIGIPEKKGQNLLQLHSKRIVQAIPKTAPPITWAKVWYTSQILAKPWATLSSSHTTFCQGLASLYLIWQKLQATITTM